MIKLYVTVWSSGEDSNLEYEISNELAEFLRIKDWGDYVDEMEEEDKTCNEFGMEISNEEVHDIMRDKSVPESIVKELSAIDSNASLVASELAVEYVLDEYPPDEWDSYGKMKADMEAGLFIPSLSFEKYLVENGWDTSDEDYDEESAKESYMEELEEEYTAWVEELPLDERVNRYGLDEYLALDYVNYGYTLDYVNKAAEK